MAKKPFFSIIIPALNEEKYLPKLLADLSAQSYRDFEVIVVDGGSKDKTIVLTQTYAPQLPRLTVITSPRAHVCTQRNLGAQHASADILIFSDADNRLPNYFLQGAKYRIESKKFDICSFWFNPDKKSSQYLAIINAVNTFFELQKSNPKYIFEAMILIKTSVFKAIGGFDEAISYSEGRSFIRNINNQKFHYEIFRDPQCTYSFRRIRREGIIKVVTSVAKIELNELLGNDKSSNYSKLYPMLGGSYFNKPRKSKNKFIKNIQKLIKDF